MAMKSRFTACAWMLIVSCSLVAPLVAQELPQDPVQNVSRDGKTPQDDKKESARDPRDLKPSKETLARWQESQRPKPTELELQLAAMDEKAIRERLTFVEAQFRTNGVNEVKLRQALIQAGEDMRKENSKAFEALDERIAKLEKEADERIKAAPGVAGVNAQLEKLKKEREEIAKRHADVFAQLEVAREEKGKGDASTRREEEILALEKQLKEMDERIKQIGKEKDAAAKDLRQQIVQNAGSDAECLRIQMEIQAARDEMQTIVGSSPRAAETKKALEECRSRKLELLRQRSLLQKTLKDRKSQASVQNANKAGT